MEKQRLNSAGYDLYEITLDEWILHIRGTSKSIYVGTFKEVIRAAISMGFKADELDFAVQSMTRCDHNGAHFGMYKKFIHSFKKEFKNVKHAS